MSSTTSQPPNGPAQHGKRRRWPAVAGGVALLAVAGVYGAGYSMAGDKLPRNTTVDGVAVGGVDAATATTRLQEALAPRAEGTITLSGQGKKATLKPAEAGLAVDYQATISQAGAGKSMAPSHIWNVLRGGGEMKPVVRVDDAKLAAAVAKAAPGFAQKPADATLAIKDDKPVTTKGRPAVALDAAKATKAVEDAYLETTSVAAPLTVTPPAVTDEEVKAALDEKLAPTLSAPVVAKTTKGKLTVDVEEIADATTVQNKDGAVQVSTDTKELFESTEDQRTEIGLVGGKDAKVVLENGRPTVRPSTDGVGIKEADFSKAITPALTATGGQRTVEVATAKVPAKYTTADAKKAGVKEVTGEFTTSFPYAEYRNTNLSVAAQRINNSYLQPGETFSLNDTLGPRDGNSGFVDGWVISGDRMKKENAGGISQSATTTFNAIFFAGLEDVEHHPHTMYFDRYPAGREATLYYGSLDLRFKNNTPHGVLLQAFVDKASPGGKGSITVKVWSTKVYDKVSSSELRKSNFTSGRTITSDSPDCHAQAPAPGFTVNYERIFSKGGSVVRTEPFSWTYSPTDEIRCS